MYRRRQAYRACCSRTLKKAAGSSARAASVHPLSGLGAGPATAWNSDFERCALWLMGPGPMLGVGQDPLWPPALPAQSHGLLPPPLATGRSQRPCCAHHTSLLHTPPACVRRMAYVANVGDSRAVLAEQQGKQLVAQDLSFDQTPFRWGRAGRDRGKCGASSAPLHARLVLPVWSGGGLSDRVAATSLAWWAF